MARKARDRDIVRSRQRESMIRVSVYAFRVRVLLTSWVRAAVISPTWARYGYRRARNIEREPASSGRRP